MIEQVTHIFKENTYVDFNQEFAMYNGVSQLNIKGVMRKAHSFLIFVLILFCSSVSLAEGLFSYAGFNVHQASLSMDDFGTTSIDDESYGFGLFAASRLYKNLHLEYGYNDLGEYNADYDFTLGSFRFVESHHVNISQTVYAGLVFKSSISDIFYAYEMSPAFSKTYVHIALGGLFWRTQIEMEGDLYDSGTLLSPYGATGDDTGLSSYFELGLGYGIGKHYILTMIFNTYFDVGKGVELQLRDGTKKEYDGLDVDTVGLELSYMF